MPEPFAHDHDERDPGVGAGRVLCLVYGFFTLAAGARSGVQLATHAAEAPFAYSLSGLAAGIYLAGLVLLIRADVSGATTSRLWARRLCQVELAGVLMVGTASLLVPRAFPDATVWSTFGQGYGFVPLVLPVLALFWLHGRNVPGRATSNLATRVVPGQKVPSGSVSGSGRREPASSDECANTEAETV